MTKVLLLFLLLTFYFHPFSHFSLDLFTTYTPSAFMLVTFYFNFVVVVVFLLSLAVFLPYPPFSLLLVTFYSHIFFFLNLSFHAPPYPPFSVLLLTFYSPLFPLLPSSLSSMPSLFIFAFIFLL